MSDTLHKSPERTWVVNCATEAVGNAGKLNQLLAPKYYIQLEIGRRREIIGLVDTTLTSGSYTWSGNALPIPKFGLIRKDLFP